LTNLIAAVLVLAGVVGLIGGCGGDSITRQINSPGSELILADPVTDTHFSLSVVSGAPTLTDIGSSGTVSSDPDLIDNVTGVHYSLAVTSGALTLVPASDMVSGHSQIGLIDTVTAKTYALVVVSDELTLIPG
jgi:hypothetical protein